MRRETHIMEVFNDFHALVFFLLSVLVPAIILLKIKSFLPLRQRQSISRSHEQSLPPSPPGGLPLVGHLHLLGSLPHRALQSIAAAHGPVVLLRLGRVPTVLVSSAAAAEEVMRTRDLAFASRPTSAVADRLLYGSDVAFAPYGEYWRQTRRICVAHLLSARRIQSFRHVREQEAGKLVDAIRRHCSSKSKAVIELGELLVAYTNNIVSRAAFGDESSRRLYEDDGDRGRQIRHVLNEFQKLIATQPVGEILPWLGWLDAVTGLDRRINRTFHALDAVLDKVIHDHRRSGRGVTTTQTREEDHRDFVDVLLEVSKNEEEYGIRLGTNEIKAIILDMFAAGTDTTTTAMEWAMAELVTHPHAMRKLQAEIRAAVGNGDVTEEHLHKLPYLKCVIKETLRLHAPVPLLVPRETTEDTELLGYRVPARTRVVVNAWAIGRDPATWGSNAGEFVPERFQDAGEVDYRGQSFELIPFGAGRRGCPGVGFAEQTVQTGLASLLYHFDWDAASSSLDMTEVNGLAVHIKAGLQLLAKPWIPSS